MTRNKKKQKVVDNCSRNQGNKALKNLFQLDDEPIQCKICVAVLCLYNAAKIYKNTELIPCIDKVFMESDKNFIQDFETMILLFGERCNPPFSLVKKIEPKQENFQ